MSLQLNSPMQVGAIKIYTTTISIVSHMLTRVRSSSPSSASSYGQLPVSCDLLGQCSVHFTPATILWNKDHAIVWRQLSRAVSPFWLATRVLIPNTDTNSNISTDALILILLILIITSLRLRYYDWFLWSLAQTQWKPAWCTDTLMFQRICCEKKN